MFTDKRKLLLLLAITVIAAENKSERIDRYGDPLPSEAIARLGTLRLRHPHEIGVFSGAFTPDGKVLASTQERGLVSFWDTITGKEIGRLRTKSEIIYLLGFSPSGRILCGSDSYSERNNLVLWEFPGGKELKRLPGHKGFALAAEFLDGGERLVSVGWDGMVRWWNLASGKMVKEWDPLAAERAQFGEKDNRHLGFHQAAFSAGGQILVGGFDWQRKKGDEKKILSQLRVWDLGRKKELARMSEKDGLSRHFSLSADGKMLAFLYGKSWRPNQIVIKEIATQREIRRIGLERKSNYINSADGFDSLSLSADGKTLAVVGGGDVGLQFWDVVSGKKIRALPPMSFSNNHLGGFGVSSNEVSGTIFHKNLTFTPDGAKFLFTVGDTLILWDIDKGKESPHFDGHRHVVTWLWFSRDGKFLCSGDDETGGGEYWVAPRHLCCWNMRDWKISSVSTRPGDYWFSFPVQASPDHRLRVFFNDKNNKFQVENRKTKTTLCTLDLPYKNGISSGGFFSQDNKVVAMPDPSDYRKILWFLDAANGKKLSVVPRPPWPGHLVLSSDHQIGAFYNSDGAIHVVRVETGKAVCRLGDPRKNWSESGRSPALVFSPDNRLLATWDRGLNTVLIWDLVTEKSIQLPCPDPQFDHYTVSLAFSPDCKLLAIGAMSGQKDIKIFELASRQFRREIRGHKKPVLSLAFSPDGLLLASGSEDTTVLIWNLYGLRLRGPSEEKLSTKKLNNLWHDLALTDARKAGEAVASLLRSPSSSLVFFKGHIKPLSSVAPKRLDQLISDLGSKEFPVRDRARQQLEELGDLAESGLRKALKAQPDLEVRLRVKGLLELVDGGSSPPILRAFRALEVLEHIDGPEARHLVQELARGAPEARLTREAKAALQRLDSRRSTMP